MATTKIETLPLASPVGVVNHEVKKGGLPKEHYVDTLSYAQEKLSDWKPEKPKLTPPSHLSYSVPRLIEVTNTSRELGDDILKTMGLRVNNIKQDIKGISAEMIEKLKEAAERANESGFWSILKKIGTCILSAITTVLGFSFISSGNVLIGGAMIASGVLSLANFALAESGAWDTIAKQIANENEQLKHQLQTILPASIGIVAGMIGAAGSVNAVVSGATDWVTKGVVAALGLFNTITGFSKGIADGRLLWTEADLLKIRGKLTLNQELFDITIGTVKESIAHFESVEKKTKKAIEMAAEASKRFTIQA